MAPQTKYARSGDVSIAYQVLGDGPIDIVLVPGFATHVEMQWESATVQRASSSGSPRSRA